MTMRSKILIELSLCSNGSHNVFTCWEQQDELSRPRQPSHSQILKALLADRTPGISFSNQIKVYLETKQWTSHFCQQGWGRRRGYCEMRIAENEWMNERERQRLGITDQFCLCPQYVMRPPVTEHVPLHSKSLCENMARASGGGGVANNMGPLSGGAQTEKIRDY